MKLLDKSIFNPKKINEMVSEIISRFNKVLDTSSVTVKSSSLNSKDDACNRLKLVLMHDRRSRSNLSLSSETLEQMRDELVDVISRYVEIDREALDLNLENDSNTIALVANIPILRNK